MKQSTKLFTLLLLLWASFCLSEAYAQSVSLSVSQDRGKNMISVGDRFYISITVKNLDEEPTKPASVPGANVLYFTQTAQSSSFSNINGKTSQSISTTYTLTLRATQEGKFSFGPITVGGVKSNTVSYAIGAPMPEQDKSNDQNRAQSQNPQIPGRNADPSKPTFIGKGDGNLFMRAEVSKSSAYVQEAIMYTVKLYSTFDAIKFIGATASPKFDGFVVEESKDISTSLTFETYNGKTYATAIIARYIIFPQLEGSLKVTGNTYTVSVDEREYYHDSYFGNMAVSRPLQLNVTPNDLTVSVKPLPKPVPEDFCGGVGNFTITSSLPAQKYSTNQAASIIYTVQGSGNLKYINLPDLQKLYPPQLEVYSPSSEANINVGRSDVSGNVKFDYSFMPLESGSYKIPEVKLVYFNPSTGQYVTSVASGYTIDVEKGVGSEKSQTKVKAKFDDQLMPVVSKLSLEHRPYVYGFLYWLFYIIPIGILSGSYIFYKSYRAANADILAVRSRKANRMARKRLKRAATYMNAGDKDNFHDEIIRSLWGYVGDKLKIPTSELSRENIYGKLAMQGIDDSQIDSLIKLIDDVEFEKYAPSSGQSQMKDIYDKTVETMNNLEEAFRRAKNENV
ncbi:MAG: protein BatD [Muribaculaceae bacterium]|nr:protein BatD [Muribaculaceae bacterium]